jgi:hypothetical protein
MLYIPVYLVRDLVVPGDQSTTAARMAHINTIPTSPNKKTR